MAAKIQKCKRHTKEYRVSLLSVGLVKKKERFYNTPIYTHKQRFIDQPKASKVFF